MRLLYLVIFIITSVLVLALPLKSQASVKLDFEFGPVFITKNDVRVPNATGTLFSLSEDLKTDASIYFRGTIIYAIGKRHNLFFMASPLRTNPQGTVNRDITFNGVTFPANSQINARYRFDSYRWTYRYDILSNSKVTFGLGLSAKIRSAEIRLAGPGLYTKFDNVGFVPLIHLKFAWNFYKSLSFLVEGEGLGAPQGRAEDFMFAIVYKPLDKFNVRLGYRFLEGGADVASTYNFAFINYLVLGARMSF